MKAKKITAVFFILVLALQLLPVKQAIKYFFSDSPLVEELAAHGNATKNFRLLGEDYLSLHGLGSASFHLTISSTYASVHFSEMLPVLYTAEILTPPPNFG